MQHKVTVALLAGALLLCAGLAGWQAWSLAQMREQLTALERQVGNSSVSKPSGSPPQTQPVAPPSSLFGGGNSLNNNAPQNLLNNRNDPFADFDQLQDEMLAHMQQLMADGMPDRLFDHVFSGFGQSGLGNNSGAQEPQLAMSENDDSYIITIDIPEDSNAEVSAAVEGNELNIEGKITVKNAGSNNGSSFTSTQSRQFARSMPLPPDANPDGLTNVTEDGRVVITIPKHA